MHILHIIATLDPKTGGTTETVRVLLSHNAEDSTSEVVTMDAPEASFLAVIPSPVHALGPVTSIYSYSRKLRPWLIANRDRFDGVVVHGMWQYAGLSVRRAMRGWVPYVVFAHGMLDPYFKHAFPLKHMKKWAYWLLVAYRVLGDSQPQVFS
jgi:hypothetical protein